MKDQRGLPTVRVTELVAEMRQALVAAIDGRSLSMVVDPDLCICGDRAELRALVAHLVLTARDGLPDGGTIRFSARRKRMEPGDDDFPEVPGEHAVLRVTAHPVGPDPVLMGVPPCRDCASMLDGHVEVEHGEATLTVTAYIPAAATAIESSAYAGNAVVLHDDPRVRETLTSALADLGCLSEEGSTAVADAVSLENVVIAFTDGPTARRLRASKSLVLVVEVVARGETTTGSGPVLTVPFELGELEALLDWAFGRTQVKRS